MTTQHTPGPWHTEPMECRPDTIWIGNAQGYIAQITREDGLTPADQADARLIAQAPALLKALQRLTHPMAGDEDLSHALGVIARATGQPVSDEDEDPEPPYAGYESEAELRRMAEVRALRAKGQV